MDSSMDAALRHAKSLAQYLSKCDDIYIIHIALKEMGIPGNEGFLYAKYCVKCLLEDPTATLSNGVYVEASLRCGHPAEEKHVEQAIRNAIKSAWKERDLTVWSCYFPIGKAGRIKCPANKDFLMAIYDFVILWKGFCEEVNHGRKYNDCPSPAAEAAFLPGFGRHVPGRSKEGST